MNTFKKPLLVSAIIAAAFVILSSARADLYNSRQDYNQWKSTNGNYATVRINDRGRDEEPQALYRLFNDYFANVQGIGANQYASGNALWQERGVKQDTVFTADSSRTVRLEAAYRVADFTHTIGLYKNNTSGNFNNGMDYGAAGHEWSASAGTYTTAIRGDTNSKFKVLSDIVDLGGYTGEMRWLLRADGNFIRDGVNTSSWSKYSSNDDLIHMLVFDVSDLMFEKLSATRGNIDRDTFTAYMVAWEDISKPGNKLYPDFDYQDFVGIYTNFGIKGYKPPFVPDPDPDTDSGTSAATPEPATLLMLGAGLAGLGLYRRRKLR